MRTLTSTMVAGLLGLSAAGVGTTALAYPGYADHWAHRSVIYFAPSKDEHVKQFLLETLQNECALNDRDIVTLVVTQDGFSMPSWVKSEFELSYLFAYYGVEPEEHTTILIGKDGTEKLRWGRETDWKNVKETIDAMPMRQREMKERGNPCSV